MEAPAPPHAGRLLSQIKWVHRAGEWLQSVAVPMGGESPGALLGPGRRLLGGEQRRGRMASWVHREGEGGREQGGGGNP